MRVSRFVASFFALAGSSKWTFWYIINKSKVVQRCLYSLIDNDIRHHSGQNVVCSQGGAEWVHNKFWPLWWWISLSIRVQTTLTHFDLFFTTLFNAKESFYFRAWPKSWHRERSRVVYNFLAIWLVYFPNGRSWSAITLRDKSMRACRVQRCLDSYRQRQISQLHCEITSNY